MDKTIIITGASSGFGLAMVERFAKEGAKLTLVARGREKLEEAARAAEKLGGEALVVCGDVTEEETSRRAVEACVARFGRVDALINNAGGGVKIAPIEEMDAASVRSVLDLNLSSAIAACRATVPQMKKQGGGLIVNLASACAKFAWPQWSVYSAAKAGLSMFGRCLYAELRPFNIAVSTIVPGGSNTGFQKNAGVASFEWDEKNSLRPEHIASAAFSIVSMERGAVVPEMVVYGMEQSITPF